MSPPMASFEPMVETKQHLKGSKGNPVGRSFESSAPVMRLPSGHKTHHWSWNLSDPALRVAQMHPNRKPEVSDDDDLFLFPLGSGSFKTPSPFTTLPSSYFMAEETSSVTDVEVSSVTSKPQQQVTAVMPGPARPMPIRTRSYTPTPRFVRATTHQRPVKRSQSITVASMKSARRRHHASVHIQANESTLKRQVADLTQRVTMLLANQCAACRLGLIQCGLDDQPGEEKEQDGKCVGIDADEGGSDGGALKGVDELGRTDWQSAPETDNSLEILARQARLMAYG